MTPPPNANQHGVESSRQLNGDLRLAHLVAERLRINAQLTADLRDRTQLLDHLHGPFPLLSGKCLPRNHEPQPSQRSRPPRKLGRSRFYCLADSPVSLSGGPGCLDRFCHRPRYKAARLGVKGPSLEFGPFAPQLQRAVQRHAVEPSRHLTRERRYPPTRTPVLGCRHTWNDSAPTAIGSYGCTVMLPVRCT